MKRWALFVLGGAVLACQPRPEPVNEARARASLLAVDREYDSATAADGVAGWTRYYVDSSRMIDRRGDFLVGPAAIGEHMRPLLSDSSMALRWTPDHAEVSADGSLGYTWGRWTSTRTDSAGSRQVGQGRYLTVWRKQPDGTWKALADIGTDTE